MSYNRGTSSIIDLAFDEGREFRLNEPIIETKVIRVVSPIDFIITLQHIAATDGEVRMRAYRSGDGVASGTFVPSVHYANNNQHSHVAYVGQIQVSVGGTFVPTNAELYKDQLVAIVSNATAHSTNVGADAVAMRGLPPETYYLVFTGGGAGDYNLILEETP